MADDRYSTIGKTTTAEIEHEAKEEANHDPITGEPGAHPVGTGVGAVGGAATGAAIGGAVGGPAGAMIGAAVGGVAGGLAGKGVAEAVNPTEEDAYWRETHASRPYAANRTYDELSPAYRYGWESRTRYPDRSWNDVENDLERGWTARPGRKLGWHEAKGATRDAWDRVTHRHENDNYWRQNYSSQPYYRSGREYDEDYRPAYNYGWDAAHRHPGKRWEDAESHLESGWERAKGKSKLTWNEAKQAARDSWHRVERVLPGDADRDNR